MEGLLGVKECAYCFLSFVVIAWTHSAENDVHVSIDDNVLGLAESDTIEVPGYGFVVAQNGVGAAECAYPVGGVSRRTAITEDGDACVS